MTVTRNAGTPGITPLTVLTVPSAIWTPPRRLPILFLIRLASLNTHFLAVNQAIPRAQVVLCFLPRVSSKMSGSSYRLQASRPRKAPSPLNFDNSSKPSSVVSNHLDSQTLLYDLPSTTSMSPTSSRSVGRVISPTSPSFPSRSLGSRGGRPTPPPSSRNRSQTPSGVASSELEQFAEYCRTW